MEFIYKVNKLIFYFWGPLKMFQFKSIRTYDPIKRLFALQKKTKKQIFIAINA